MHRAISLVTLILGIGLAFAAPIHHPLAPLAWPTLRLNSEEPPSCVFGNSLGAGGTPAYFCAMIVKNPSVEPTLGNGGLIAGALVDPMTGVITPVVPFSVQAQPQAVQCVLNGSLVDCLFYTENAGTLSLVSLSNGTLGPPAVTFPTTPKTNDKFVSNISCVPWASGTTSCFVIDAAAQIRQWTFMNGAWSTPQDLSAGSGITGPGLPLDLAQWSIEPWNHQMLSCSSSTVGSSAPTVDCFVTATQAFSGLPIISIGNLVRLPANGSSLSPAEGLLWGSITNVSPAVTLATAPSCVSAITGRSDCFFGFGSGPPAMTGLGDASDTGTPPAGPIGFLPPILIHGALLQRSNVLIPPSCLSFSPSPGPGAFECVFDYNPGVDGSDIPTGNFANATIEWAISNGAGFWIQPLGVAAPSEELVRSTVNGRMILHPASRPKAVKSLTCAKGPNFQSLCVAAVVESPIDPFAATTPEFKAFESKKYRLEFKLVGAIGAGPAPPSFRPKVPVKHPTH